jgi:hypothetical protein
VAGILTDGGDEVGSSGSVAPTSIAAGTPDQKETIFYVRHFILTNNIKITHQMN